MIHGVCTAADMLTYYGTTSVSHAASLQVKDGEVSKDPANPGEAET